MFGRTLNAYDQSKTAGGSSGGAGVAVALHMLPVADGTDHGGSLRNPAAYNNVFGFRPSFGRVPANALDGFYAIMGTPGPMARNVPDLAALLSVQAGYDPRAPLSNRQDPAQFAGPLKRDFKGARIAWAGDFGGHLPFEPGILDLCKSALKVFEALGCTVEEAVPDYPIERVWQNWKILRAWQSGSALKALLRRSGQARADEAGGAVRGRKRPEAHRLRHLRRRRGSHRLVSGGARVLRALRLFPAAVVAGVPVRRRHRLAEGDRRQDHGHLSPLDGGDDPGHHVELSGAVACRSVSATGGLPMGLQIVGPNHGELACLQLAHAYDEATKWVTKRPPPLLG